MSHNTSRADHGIRTDRDRSAIHEIGVVINKSVISDETTEAVIGINRRENRCFFSTVWEKGRPFLSFSRSVIL